MALSPNVGAERAVVTWEVGPTEEVVQAFIEYLVDPRLPSLMTISLGNLPSEVQQESVARQMHAVVVLYNFYHRRQKPELEFLDFLSFCTLAVKIRPAMAAFMRWTNERESTEFNGAEDQLSITEKSIKDACEISAKLDASVDFPDKEHWPITKVAVLVIDSKKENCMLEFGPITEGVWSLFEKDLDKPHINQEILSEYKSGEKRKRTVSRKKSVAADYELLQIGYDVVKQKRGIEDHKLKLLASHVTYSLNKERSRTQLYLVQATADVNFTVSEEVPLKYIAESLQGPLATKFCGIWSQTDIVSHYHMLPYEGFVSKWLSQHKDSWPPSIDGDSDDESIINVCSPALISPKQDPDCIDNNSSWSHVTKNNDEYHKKRRHSSWGELSWSCVTENNDECHKKRRHSSWGELSWTRVTENNDECHKRRRHSSWGELSEYADKIQSVETDKHAMEEVNQKHDDPSGPKEHENVSPSGPTSGLSLGIERDENALTKVNTPPATLDSAKHESARNNIENLEAKSADKSQSVDTDMHTTDEVNQKYDKPSGLNEREHVSLSGPTSGLSLKIERDDNVLTKVYTRHATHDSAKHESTRDNFEYLEAKAADNIQSVDTDMHATYEVNQKHDEPSGLKECDNVSLSGPTSGLSLEIEGDDNVLTKVSTPPATLDSAKHESTRNNVEYLEAKAADKVQSVDTDMLATDEVNQKHDEASGLKERDNASLSVPTSGLSVEIEGDDNVLSKVNTPPATLDSAKHDSTRNNIEYLEAKAADKIQSVDTDKHATDEVNQKHEPSGPRGRENVSLSGPTSRLSLKIESDDNVLTKVNRPAASPDSANYESTRNNIENLEAINVDVPNNLQSGPSKGHFQKTFATDNDALKFSKDSNVMFPVIKKEGKIGPGTSNKEREACENASLFGPSRDLESVSDLHGTSRNDGGTSEKLNFGMIVYHRRSKKLSSTRIENNGPDNSAHLNTELASSLTMSHDNQCNDGKVSGRNGGVGISSDQSGTATAVDQLCQLETTTKPTVEIRNESGPAEAVNRPCQLETATKPTVEIQNLPASDVVHNALALLYNKRQQQFSQICSKVDMLARYEHCIQRIRDSGEVSLAQECMTTILSGNSSWTMNHEVEQTGSSCKNFVPGKSKCQDLEDMCYQNNWRLPKYIVQPSEGKFSSNVVFVHKKLELISKGGLESSPSKARESAAAQMIADIREHLQH